MNTIQVTGLHPKVTEEILEKAFSECGTVDEVNILPGGKSATIIFDKQSEALEAVKLMDGSEIMKKRCEVSWICQKSVRTKVCLKFCIL
jgi:RNA recognition motif-containing protein